MTPNPVLNRLGLAADDRAVIFHADDIGFCHASIQAYERLLCDRVAPSASLMVPCPWFPAAAQLAAQHRPDLGVHLTLTSEWTACRWGPLSTRDPSSGLLDGEGYFPRTVDALVASATPAAVGREFDAQVAAARALGVDVTHLDTHMLSAVQPQLWDRYLNLALTTRLPVMLPRFDEAQLRALDVPDQAVRVATLVIHQLEEIGFPLIDAWCVLPAGSTVERRDGVVATLAKLPPGIHHVFLHPAVDCAELRALADDWVTRVSDYELLASGFLVEQAGRLGIHTLGYRELRALVPATSSTAAAP